MSNFNTSNINPKYQVIFETEEEAKKWVAIPPIGKRKPRKPKKEGGA